MLGRLLENTLTALELASSIPKGFILQTGGKVSLVFPSNSSFSLF
jgi:hypothetical protein